MGRKGVKREMSRKPSSVAALCYILTERQFWLMIADRTCRTCAWHDGFSWVCFNGESEHRADFTLDDQTCPYWQKHRTAEQRRKSRKQAESRKRLLTGGSTADGGSIGC